MGINGVAGSLGVATGPYLGLLMVEFGHWRWAYWAIAGLSLLAGTCSLMLRFSTPAVVSPVTAKAKPAISQPATSKRVAPLILLYAAMLFGGLNYRCMTTALPSLINGSERLTEARGAE